MSSTRTFIAIPLSAAATQSLERLVRNLRRANSPSVRWIAPENFHVNLVFLGDVENAVLRDVCRIAALVCAEVPSFSWRPKGTGGFPNTARANVLWVGVDDPTGSTITLHDALEEELLAIGYQPESRRFRPHVTIGRTRRGNRIPAELSSALNDLAEWRCEEVETEEVHVLASDLGREGPHYSVLARCPLGR